MDRRCSDSFARHMLQSEAEASSCLLTASDESTTAAVEKKRSFAADVLAHILLRHTSSIPTLLAGDSFTCQADEWASCLPYVSPSDSSFTSVTSGHSSASAGPLPAAAQHVVGGLRRSAPSFFSMPAQSQDVEMSRSSVTSSSSLANFTVARNQLVAAQAAGGMVRTPDRQHRSLSSPAGSKTLTGRKRPAQIGLTEAKEHAGGAKSSLETLFCRINGCGADITSETAYFRKYKFCRVCIKQESVMHKGEMQRFCQQCSFFHPISEFDGLKRSCRAKLQRHKALMKSRTSSTKKKHKQ